MKKIIGTFVLLTIIAAVGCSSSRISIPPTPDGKKSYEQFVTSNSFPYSIEEGRKNQLIKNYEKTRLGMTKQEFNALLGEPDFSQNSNTKEGTYIGSKWTYYFYKPKSNNVNLKLDREIVIFFSMDDRAKWIAPCNIEGLTEKGGPRRSNIQPALRP